MMAVHSHKASVTKTHSIAVGHFRHATLGFKLLVHYRLLESGRDVAL